jgi:8-oxo-dGTP pyrophosphatase MutT (NUDIX family)
LLECNWPLKVNDLYPVRTSVLVATINNCGKGALVFTKRNESLSNHPGQISFPGGKALKGENPKQTALREAKEEICLDPLKCEVLGCLPASQTLVGPFSIVPVVAIYKGDPSDFKASQDEVAEILIVNIEEFFDFKKHRTQFRVNKEGNLLEVHFFDTSKAVIWGATARIVVEFLKLFDSTLVAD